jgi:hypothetical protein
MSWGFWGTVTGLVIFLAGFFIWMELLYASARSAGKAGGAMSPPTETGEPAQDVNHHHAA